MSRARSIIWPPGLPTPASAAVSPHFPLYVSDDLLARIILGDCDAKLWRQLLPELSRDGLPAPRALFGSRRYLPAVLLYFDRREGLLDNGRAGYADDGDEYFG